MLNNFIDVFLRRKGEGVLFLLLALLITQDVTANEDFNFSADISSGKQSLRQFELPYEVLEGLQRQDYGDMRILNSQNQSIPFKVIVVQPKNLQYDSEHELDFFTLPKNPHRRSRLRIEFNKYNSWFSYSSTTTSNSRQRSFIIIENPYTEKGLNKLKLHWTPPNHAFSLKLKLEQSDDLEQWRIVKHQTTLYDLKHDSTLLIKDTISLSKPSKAKYLRISFIGQHYFLHSINKINAYYHHQSQSVPENWKTLTLKQGETALEWLFNTGSVAPISKISFEIPQAGLFYQGTLFSKNTPLPVIKHTSSKKRQLKKEAKKILHQPAKSHKFWRYRQGFTQYRLLTESGEISSEPFSLTGINDSQWRMVLTQPLSLLPEQIPNINVSWNPVKVTFLAQGNEPYRLLYGNSKVKPLYVNVPSILKNTLPEIVKISASKSVEKTLVIADKTVSFSDWAKKMVWQKALLWLLLCAGVLLMGTMAYKLYLGMNK